MAPMSWVRADADRLDVISALWAGRLLHVLARIWRHVDSVSLAKCAAVSADWRNAVFACATRTRPAAHVRHEENICSIARGAQGSVVAGFTNGRICLLDTWLRPQVWVNAHSGPVTAVAIVQPSYRTDAVLVSGSLRGALRVWNAATGPLLVSLPCHRDWVTSLSPVSDVVFSCGLDGRVAVVRCFRRPPDCAAVITDAKTAKAFESVAAVSVNKCVVAARAIDTHTELSKDAGGLWLLERVHGSDEWQTTRFPVASSCGAVAADCDTATVVAADVRGVLVFAVASSRPECVRVLRRGSVACSALDVRRGLVAAAFCDGVVRMWDLRNGSESCVSARVAAMANNIIIDAGPFVQAYVTSLDEPQRITVVTFDEDDEVLDSGEDKGRLKICSCGFEIEPSSSASSSASFHVLLSCPLRSPARRRLLQAAHTATASSSSTTSAFLSLAPRSQLEVLLYGAPHLPQEVDLAIQKAVQEFSSTLPTR